jgi:hypothetical protein
MDFCAKPVAAVSKRTLTRTSHTIRFIPLPP